MEPAPRPAGSAPGTAQPAGHGAWEGQQDAQSEALGWSCFPTPGSPRPPPVLWPDAGVPYREPGAPTARAGAAGLLGAWCCLRPRPGSGPRQGDWGIGEAWARGEQSRSPGEQRGRRRRRQRLTESAPRPAPGVGAGDRRAGLGAGAREERLTVKSQAKAQKTRRQEHRHPSHASPGERTVLLMWHNAPPPPPAFPSCPPPAKLATLSRVSSLPRC